MRTGVGLRCTGCGRPDEPTVRVGGGRRRRRTLAVCAGCISLAALGAVAVLRNPTEDGTRTGRPPVAEGSWSTAPTLSAIRGSTIAVALPSGFVLVAGGGIGAIPVAATELFDPTSGTWRAAGPMVEARRGHQAVVLGDGRVLVAGGVSAGRPLASAELYEPARETWTATGSMGAARLGHSLTLLADGRVLAAGGTSLDAGGAAAGEAVTPVDTTEVFDPTTGRWTPGAVMTAARFDHTATRLADGRVLVAGGLGATGGGSPLSSTELYDPAAGAFVGAAPLGEARSNHAATALADHRVLVVGGVGGPRADVGLGSAEVFDPSDGSWRRTSPLAHARSGATATALAGGRVLVVGGEAVDRGVRRSLAGAEVLDPGSRAWTGAGRMACPRSEHAAVRLGDGDVLVVAGDGAFPGRPAVAQSCVDRYRPAPTAARR